MTYALDNATRVPVVNLWGTGGIASLILPADAFFFGWIGPSSTGASARFLMYFAQNTLPPNGSLPLWCWELAGGSVPKQAIVTTDHMGGKPIQSPRSILVLSSTAPALTVLGASTMGVATTIYSRI